MMHRTTRLIIVAVALAGSVLTACGDDTTAALSKPDFVERANAICAATDAELEPVWDELWAMDDIDFDDPAELDEAGQDLIFERFADAMDTIGPTWRESIDEIRALGVPTADAETVESMLDDLEAAIDTYMTITRAAADGDVAARERMDDSAEDPMADVNRRARDYGLTVCGAED